MSYLTKYFQLMARCGTISIFWLICLTMQIYVNKLILFHTYWDFRIDRDRLDLMKNSYGIFFIQSQSRINFLTRGNSRFIQSEISCQNESVSLQTCSCCFLAPVQSSFTEVCRVSTSFLEVFPEVLHLVTLDASFDKVKRPLLTCIRD